MNNNAFEYGGYHFVPERQFRPEEDDFFKIAKRQRFAPDLGICEKNYIFPCRHEYSHADFYRASPDKTCDLFRCVENGKLYLPCGHDLQEYVEDVPTPAPAYNEQNGGGSVKDDVRMAGDYEITQTMAMGGQKIVLGENLQAPPDERYMCAFCRDNGLRSVYTEEMAYGSYVEAVKDFSDRIKALAIQIEVETRQPAAEGIDNAPVEPECCTLLSENDDLRNRIVVIRQDVLRPEYRDATHQIKLCVGGFGATPHSRGSACYCVNLHTGATARFERRDILGTMTPEQVPEWAKRGLEKYQHGKKHDRRMEAR